MESIIPNKNRLPKEWCQTDLSNEERQRTSQHVPPFRGAEGYLDIQPPEQLLYKLVFVSLNEDDRNIKVIESRPEKRISTEQFIRRCSPWHT